MPGSIHGHPLACAGAVPDACRCRLPPSQGRHRIDGRCSVCTTSRFPRDSRDTMTAILNQAMNCSACGRLVGSDAMFCPYCGTRIARISGGPIAFEPYVRAADVAKLVGCSAIKIRRMAEAGKIPAVAFPVGRRRKTWRFRMSTVQRWLDDLEKRSLHQGVARQKSHPPEAALESPRRASKRTARKAQ